MHSKVFRIRFAFPSLFSPRATSSSQHPSFVLRPRSLSSPSPPPPFPNRTVLFQQRRNPSSFFSPSFFVHRSHSVSLCLSTARRRSMRGWPFSSLLASFLSWCSGSSTKPLSGLSSWVPLPFLLRLSFLTLSLSLSLSLFSMRELLLLSLDSLQDPLLLLALEIVSHTQRERTTNSPAMRTKSARKRLHSFSLSCWILSKSFSLCCWILSKSSVSVAGF